MLYLARGFLQPPNGSRLSCGPLKEDSFPNLRAPSASSACYAAGPRTLPDQVTKLGSNRWLGSPLPVPANRSVQRRRASFAPLLKSQVQRHEDAVGVDDAVHHEP